MDKCLHIIPRKIAKERGLKRYFTGRPCKNRGLDQRYTINGRCDCSICTALRYENAKHRVKKWYEENRDLCISRAKVYAENAGEKKRREWQRRYYQKASKDSSYVKKRLEETRDWKSRNKEKIQAYNRQWREKNAEHLREWAKEQRRKFPEKHRAKNQNRRARLIAAEGQYSRKDVLGIIEKQKRKCAACFVGIRGNDYHVDHIIPLAKGGTNWPDNLQILCPTCNMRKGAKDPIEWAQENGRLL